MAGELHVEASIGDRPDIEAYLDEAFRKRVRHSAGACRRCVKNEDPDKIPLHKHCRCSWYWEQVK